jgi:4'-phosphopantetheinyl transferase
MTLQLPDTTWHIPPHSPLLKDEIHIWRAGLKQPHAWLEKSTRWLNAVEQARAAKFRLEPDRLRFQIGRSVLRLLLSHYLNVQPDAINFEFSRYGKPYLAGTPLHFNISHSGDWVLLAFSRPYEIGIDVEQQVDRRDLPLLAAQYFSPAEAAALKSLPAENQLPGFYDGWTRKEAYIKGQGAGLALPLADFDVTIPALTPERLLAHRGDPAEVSRWWLVPLRVESGYSAAFAVASGEIVPAWHHFTWTPDLF